jgi:hypothetical protein
VRVCPPAARGCWAVAASAAGLEPGDLCVATRDDNACSSRTCDTSAIREVLGEGPHIYIAIPEDVFDYVPLNATPSALGMEAHRPMNFFALLTWSS